MGKYPELSSRLPTRSKTDGVGIVLWICARMIKEAMSENKALSQADALYILNILASLPGSDIKLELANLVGIAPCQLEECLPTKE